MLSDSLATVIQQQFSVSQEIMNNFNFKADMLPLFFK